MWPPTRQARRERASERPPPQLATADEEAKLDRTCPPEPGLLLTGLLRQPEALPRRFRPLFAARPVATPSLAAARPARSAPCSLHRSWTRRRTGRATASPRTLPSAAWYARQAQRRHPPSEAPHRAHTSRADRAPKRHSWQQPPTPARRPARARPCGPCLWPRAGLWRSPSPPRPLHPAAERARPGARPQRTTGRGEPPRHEPLLRLAPPVAAPAVARSGACPPRLQGGEALWRHASKTGPDLALVAAARTLADGGCPIERLGNWSARLGRRQC
mmetsp:Transcript_2764/g.11145  ORF Transcript_2764/g.11145 Transcript_2764/m.11145 type:complete len:274 (-) Transcript_2764:403-1224(-)